MSSPVNNSRPSPFPPPPSQGAAGPTATGLRRFPVQRPTITTAVASRHRLGGLDTPNSGISGTSPFSPSLRSPTFAVPSSSMPTRISAAVVTPYNPQQWNQGSPQTGASVRTSGPRRAPESRDATGMEPALPSPPPPYSPSPDSVPQSARAFYPSPNLSNFGSQTGSPTNIHSNYNSPTSAATSVSSGGPSSGQRPAPSTPGIGIGIQTPPSSWHTPAQAAERDRSTSRSRFTSTFTGRHRPTDSTVSNTALGDHPQQASDYTASTALPTAAILLPPGARRAASTGCLTPQSSTPSLQSPDPETNTQSSARGYGFPLPPPPPGPPPNLRSQSLNRVIDRSSESDTGDPLHSTFRSAPYRDQLGPVPPTPADWVEDEQHRRRFELTQATTVAKSTGVAPTQERQNTRSAHGDEKEDERLPSRSRAIVNRESTSLREIRERRSQSRGGRLRAPSQEPQTAVDAPSDSWSADLSIARPLNLDLSSSSAGALGRRRRVSKSQTSPLSDGVSPHHSGVLDSGRQISDHTSRASPVPNSAPSIGWSRDEASPATEPRTSDRLQSSPASTMQSAKTSPRIISRVLHVSSQAQSPFQSISSPRPSSSTSQTQDSNILEGNAFARASLDRYKSFVMQEARAQNDSDRLKIFAEFLVKESRVRRDRYSHAFESLGSKVFDLTRDLWRSEHENEFDVLYDAQRPDLGLDTKRESLRKRPETPNDPSSASSLQSSVAFTPNSSADSPGGQAKGGAEPRQNNYQPILSPIPSMAMSAAPEDEDSRGRAASRWWEGSTGAGSIGDARRVERSRRETKYMGLPREARENLQWDAPQSSPGFGSSNPAPDQQSSQFNPNEYPPEKIGWHEEPRPSPRLTHHSKSASKAKETPKLDVSRLVTLPPPYPRHHPAVNNNHPDLNDLRSILRYLADKSETVRVRERFASREPPPDSPSIVRERRSLFRRRIQDDVSNGQISFAEAARHESDFDAQETKRSRQKAQKDFDLFQAEVLSPLNTQYTDKMKKASDSIDKICANLSDDTRSLDPNQTQEEGDEKPELLEKLTLVKWFFEAREQLYKESFELESESDERYKVVILLPYRVTGNYDKIKEVDSFFVKDSHDRRLKYEDKSAQRFELFLKIVEQNVSRGAENQLSAFWDIAPSLLEIVQKIPADLVGFDVLIPEEDYEDSPSYEDFPLQYLFSLLQHAGMSAYQFIESQTNLFCLLHEVKSGVMTAGCRILETQRIIAGEDKPSVKREMQAIRSEEDNRLTMELKERVGVVEDQWMQALGREVHRCEARIKAFLVAQNGWDESLEE
ncbi:MAG: hypothetical protein M1828_002233 [Chrysothrix sp. TS-e1954]|nr:MAG: hypothetical protein M1828_002233 [Chrysothrix sp. TS-e1954]